MSVSGNGYGRRFEKKEVFHERRFITLEAVIPSPQFVGSGSSKHFCIAVNTEGIYPRA